MANCGCTDSVPCGTQECGCKFEVDAGCVRYTGDELTCINSSKGDILSDILINLNEKFCNLIEGNYIEVSQEPIGANCEEGGLKIVVRNINTEVVINTEYLCTAVDNYILPTATSSILGGVKIGTGLNIDGAGILSATYNYTLPTASPTVLGGIKIGTGLSIDGSGVLSTSSGISGSGLNNYVARWTPNNTTLGYGVIRDDGSGVGVGIDPNSAIQLFLATSTKINGITSNVSTPLGSEAHGYTTTVNGDSILNSGLTAQISSGTTTNIGVRIAVGSGGSLSPVPAGYDYGVFASARSTVRGNIGGFFLADTGGTSRYALQLQDGTEVAGKVLTCITSDGKANWATPTYANLQKVITATYVLTDADNDYTIFINNNSTAISISLGAITIPNFSVGFIQEGTGDVTFSGVTNPVGLKSKGQGYQTYIERKLATTTYYLLGNTKV